MACCWSNNGIGCSASAAAPVLALIRRLDRLDVAVARGRDYLFEDAVWVCASRASGGDLSDGRAWRWWGRVCDCEESQNETFEVTLGSLMIDI